MAMSHEVPHGTPEQPAAVVLATTRWGSGPGRALLLHGIVSAGATWWRLAETLADDGYEVVAPDLRGHGASPRADSYLLADHVADVRALGTGWDLVVGHSLGGLLGALAADADHGFTRRLVLLDPALDIREDRYTDGADAEIEEATHPPSARVVQGAHAGWDRRDAAAVAAAAKAADAAAVAHTLRDNAPWRHADVVTRLVVPTLVLGADPARGALFQPRTGVELMIRNPSVRVRVVVGAGHAVHRDRPSVVAAAIRSFLW
ncbi:alpha-beta hydrolase superfamily lysophospholipase [Promicromonospora sp. AC04]|uniref:alpha/beta fold hydrolase n=1 Tax=Promicromonospora sp. AC04 TaxID=2135723 RepID=UPI000D3786B2|nr:alpha/beta hydrolase [Promicromonospora sp. AC04]PUB25576.1 alpha-beta hydrolase superfamily lysophospholipase [Promicromonospora sp. AC04]